MSEKRFSRGMIQVYTGNGKGKTSAALGLACRAVGHGYKVFMIQFMKGNIEYGEIETARRLAPHLTIRQMGRECFVERHSPSPEDVRLAHEALTLAREAIMGGEYDIVVLDEVNVAMDFGLIKEEDVLRLMDERPSHLELILTGRYAPKKVVQRADLVTEMLEIKHYYTKGVESREGIEQ